MSHNERCKDCKKRIFELLTKIYGEVKEGYNLNLPAHLEEYEKYKYYKDLQKIYLALQNYRNHKKFISYRVKKLPAVDYFVVNQNFIVEVDESQHFTKPRKITLQNYPQNLNLGFDKQKWIKLCEQLDRHDNDPNPWRDETRSWYETLRDFTPSILNMNPTIRLYIKDHIWCSFNPENSVDIEKFKKIIEAKK
jgi:hypothetical protein